MSDAGPAASPLPAGGGIIRSIVGWALRSVLSTGTGRRAFGGAGLGLVWLILAWIYGFAISWPVAFIAAVLFTLGIFAPNFFTHIMSILILVFAIPAAVFILASKIHLSIMLLIPMMFMYSIVLAANQKTRVYGLILLWLFIGYFAVVATLPQSVVDQLPLAGPLGVAVELQRESFNKLVASLGNFVKGTGKYIEVQTAIATGDYYTSQVDEGAQKQLGVFLNPLKQTDAVLYENQPVAIYTTLRAETIDKPISIDLSCIVDPGTPNATAGIIDPMHIEVEQFEQEPVDCSLRQLPPSNHNIQLRAAFDFQTLAYIRGYFIDKNRLRALRQKGDTAVTDFLRQQGITDIMTTAKDTPGPVTVGMSLGEQPLALDSQQASKVTLGITVDNAWEGRLTELSQLEVTVPFAFNILTINGRSIIAGDCTPQQGETLCIFAPATYGINATPDSNLYSTFRVVMQVPSSAQKQVLSVTNLETGEQREVPVAIKNFKVTARYRYTLEQSLPIIVRKVTSQAEQPGIS